MLQMHRCLSIGLLAVTSAFDASGSPKEELPAALPNIAEACDSLLHALSRHSLTQYVRLNASGGRLTISNRPAEPPSQGPLDEYHKNTHVLLSMPRSAFLTEQGLRAGRLAYFLDAPEYRQMLRKQQLKVPAHFVFALFYLHQLHARGKTHAEPLWQVPMLNPVAVQDGPPRGSFRRRLCGANCADRRRG